MRRTLISAIALFCCLSVSSVAEPVLGDLDGIQLPQPASQTASVSKVNEGASLLAAGQSLKAEEILNQAVADNPGCAEGYYNLGLALAFNGKHAEALAAHRKALELRADFPEARLAFGIAHLTLNQPKQALEAFDSVLARIPDSPAGRAALFDKGTALGRLKRYTEAELCLSEALAADPDDPAPAFQIGKLKMEQGKWQDALGWFETTVSAYPLESHILSGRAHLKLRNRSAAEHALDQAVSCLATDTQNEATKARLTGEIDSLRKEASQIVSQ